MTTAFRSIAHRCTRAITLSIVLPASAAVASVIFTSLSRDSLTVGDRVQYSVGLMVPKGATVVPPAADQGFGSLVVKDWTTEKHELAAADSISFRYLLTTYTVDTVSIPELSFVVAAGGKIDTLKTKALPLRVGSVLPNDTVDIKELKPQQVAGKPSYWYLWAIAGAAALAAAFWFGRRLFSKAARARPEPPPLPPYEEALAAIGRLESKKLLEKGMIREYVFDLSDIFKRYIERRFDVNAAEFTTEEMVTWVRGAGFERTIKAGAEWFFVAADPVKFARVLPGDEATGRFMREVRSFLESTKPSPPQPQAQSATGTTNATPRS